VRSIRPTILLSGGHDEDRFRAGPSSRVLRRPTTRPHQQPRTADGPGELPATDHCEPSIVQHCRCRSRLPIADRPLPA
jgi:hypothetical protein